MQRKLARRKSALQRYGKLCGVDTPKIANLSTLLTPFEMLQFLGYQHRRFEAKPTSEFMSGSSTTEIRIVLNGTVGVVRFFSVGADNIRPFGAV